MSTSVHLANILHQFLPNYIAQHTLPYHHEKICRHIEQCRTAEMGAQQWQCENCLFEKVVYCSCRDRHCPRCQGKETQQWVDKQQANLINCKYFHLVFTLPHELNVIAQYAPEKLYKSLFQAVWKTLSKFAQTRKQQQGQLGLTAVLHTWGQTLSQHIHLHCLIPGGVLSDSQQWKSIKKDYLYPVKALSTVFKAKMFSELRQQEISIPMADTLMKKSWCVYSKRCLCQPKTVIQYLGRYTKQGILKESRLLAMDKQQVTFSYKNYHDNKKKQMSLSGEEFIRRYLCHLLPKGFMRIRHFGFLANRCRRKKLVKIRSQLPKIENTQKSDSNATEGKQLTDWHCPVCKTGVLTLIAIGRVKSYQSG